MLRILLVSDLGNNIGLCHYSRAKILKKEIISCYKRKAQITNLFISEEKNKFIKTTKKKNFEKKLFELIKIKKINKLIFNVSRFFEPEYTTYKILSQKKFRTFRNRWIHKKKFFFQKIWIPNIALKQKLLRKKNKIWTKLRS